jgi:hypothetical protein
VPQPTSALMAMPREQISSASTAASHAPQCSASLSTSTQIPSQASNGAQSSIAGGAEASLRTVEKSSVRP